MTLEFHKLTKQVEQMGEVLAAQEEEIESRVDVAIQVFEAYADEALLPYIHQRVQDAVTKDAGYRGARPLDEPIMRTFSPSPLPQTATLVATDGSQILPRPHGPALYYLINTGTIVVHHGTGEPPEINSEPFLYYEPGYLYTEDHGLITAAMVAARRTVLEMAALAEHAWLRRGEARPLLALLDNPLLLIGLGQEIPDRDQLHGIYFSAMTRLMEVKAGLAGYTDRPRSRYITGLLHLLDLPEEEVTRSALANDGRIEGVLDAQIIRRLLRPGERSALFVQMSPQNKDFRRIAGESHEIAFFYLNVAAPGEPPCIVRIEVPMWVARDRRFVAEMQALIYHQSHQMVSRYPYVLTRAHELAVVKQEESRQLELMIQVALARYGLDSAESEKQLGKDAVSGTRTRFEVH